MCAAKLDAQVTSFHRFDLHFLADQGMLGIVQVKFDLDPVARFEYGRLVEPDPEPRAGKVQNPHKSGLSGFGSIDLPIGADKIHGLAELAPPLDDRAIFVAASAAGHPHLFGLRQGLV